MQSKDGGEVKKNLVQSSSTLSFKTVVFVVIKTSREKVLEA